MSKKIVSRLFFALAAVFLSISPVLAQTHVEKARALDEYIKKQNRSLQSRLPKTAETPSQERLKEAIAAGFKRYNSKLSRESGLEYAAYVIDSSRRFGIDDPTLIAAMIIKESRAKPRARSRYAYGLMQIHWKVHKKSIAREFPWIKTLEDLLNPKNNVMVGTWIFSNYLKRSNGDVHKALHRYLGSSGRGYVSKIMSYRSVIRSYVQENQ